MGVTGQHQERPGREIGNPRRVMGEHDGGAFGRQAAEQCIALRPLHIAIGYADKVDRVILELQRVPRMIEHIDAAIAERVRHGALAIDVVVVAEDGEPAERRVEARKCCGGDARRHAPAAERLQLASLLWRLRRATLIETGLFEMQGGILQRRHRDQLRHESNNPELLYRQIHEPDVVASGDLPVAKGINQVFRRYP